MKALKIYSVIYVNTRVIFSDFTKFYQNVIHVIMDDWKKSFKLTSVVFEPMSTCTIIIKYSRLKAYCLVLQYFFTIIQKTIRLKANIKLQFMVKFHFITFKRWF